MSCEGVPEECVKRLITQDCKQRNMPARGPRTVRIMREPSTARMYDYMHSSGAAALLAKLTQQLATKKPNDPATFLAEVLAIRPRCPSSPSYSWTAEQTHGSEIALLVLAGCSKYS